LSPVTRRMNTDREMDVMTTSFLEVVGVTVASMEGDTEIEDIQLLYQDLIDEEKEEDVVTNTTNTTEMESLSVDFIVFGKCRDCSDKEFEGIVNTITTSHLDAYRIHLQQNGNTVNSRYFSTVDRVVLAIPQTFSDLKPIEDETLYDTQVAVIQPSRMPAMVILGMFFAVCILATGLLFIWKEIQDGYEYEKDDDAISTASESVLCVDKDFSAERPNYKIGRHRRGSAVQEYNMHEKEDPIGMVYRTSLNEYQVETVLSDEIDPKQDGREMDSYPYAVPSPRQKRQWPKRPESHQANYFGDDDWVPVPVRPPKGARRASATVSPATGMPLYTYAY
jgi:hypothetical protein